MATPKLNKLIKRFMNQIQDPVEEEAGVILPGVLIRSVSEIEAYIGQACAMFIDAAWKQSNFNVDNLLRAAPSLYQERSATVPISTQKVNLSTTHADIFSLLDSRGTSIILEVWDPARLSGALSGTDPFYVGSSVRGGMILQRPYLHVFPSSLTTAGAFNFTLCFLQAAVNPTDGSYLTSGGTYDLNIDEIHFDDIVTLATKLYKIDDYQEDAG